jgi:hypothetical protein
MESGPRTLPQGESFLPGDTLAERFTIEKFMGVEVIGESYLARDEKESRNISVAIIPAKFIRGSSILDKIKSEIKTVSGIVHRNVLTCLGMGTLSNGSIYIITEYTEGQKLYSVLQKRRENNKTFSLRGACNLIVHLCNGLEEAHRVRIHGSLSPFSIRISTTGRVKIADFPLSRLYYMFPIMRKEIPNYVQHFWAPEVLKIGSFVTERADIYSLGVVLFELLTSGHPEEGSASIAACRADLPPGIDDIVASCLCPEPSARWNSVTALRTAFMKMTEDHERAAQTAGQDDDLLMDLEVDVDKPMTVPPPPPPPRKMPPAPPGAAAKPRPAAARPSPSPHDAEIPIEVAAEPPGAGPRAGAARPIDDMAPAATAAAPAAAPAGKKAAAGKINLDDIISSLDDQDAEKWMVTRDGMDHGPFRTREVVQMIMRWEIEGQHVIQDLDKGIRVKLRESEQFKELVERAKIEKQRKEELDALARSEKAEKRGGVAKIFIVLAVLGGIGVIIGGYFVTRAAVHRFSGGGQEVNLENGVKIDIGKGGILAGGQGKGHGGKHKGGSGPGGLSYDDYMAQGVDIGDLAGDGGQTQLSQGQINAVMSSQGKKIYPCIYAELKKNPSLNKVKLKFAIEGKTGNVQGVSVTSGGSSEFQSCISSKMRGIKFPTFGLPRMGATFYFDVGR